MTRVGVVGAGITGLALTHYLDELGLDVVTFEDADRPGGVIHTTRSNGRVLEHGPQRIRLTSSIRELVAAAGIETSVVEALDVPLYVYARGGLRTVPRSVGSFLTTDLLSIRGKLRVLAEPLTAPGRPDETAAALFSRKFGDEAYENLIGPLFGGIYGSDPAAMPARHALSGLLALEQREGNLLRPALRRAWKGESAPVISFEDGLQTLPDALAERHASRVQFGTAVESIADAGDGYELVTDRGVQTVDRVVVTTPADVAGRLLSEVADGASALRRLRYNPLAIVHLHSEADVEGFGYQVRPDEGLETLGVSWNASLFDRDGVFTCFLGGMRSPGLVERAPAEIGEIARREFEAVVGAEASVSNVTRLEQGFPAWDRSWDALEEVSLPAGVRLATNYTGRMGVPSRVREVREIAGDLDAREDHRRGSREL